MPNHLSVGLFDADTNLDQLVQELVNHGFDRGNIAVSREPDETVRAAGATKDRGLITLFGDQPIPDIEVEHFAEGLRRGGAVVSVLTTSEAEAEEAARILDLNGAVDIEEHAAQWRATGWQIEKGEEAAAIKSAELLNRATTDEYQSGRTRGSRIFVW